MLKALYEYGRAHPDCVLLPGEDLKGVKYTVDIGADGSVLGVSEFGKEPVRRPYLGITGVSTKASPFAEKAWISIHMDEGSNQNVKERRACFMNHFEECAKVSREAAAVFDVIRTDGFYDSVIQAAENAGIKPGDCVGFRYDGRLLTDYASVRDWWTKYFSDNLMDVAPDLTLDLLTGKPCHAVMTSGKKLMGLQGSPSSGCVAISFNGPAFESYGLKQNANAPMSADTMSYAMDALAELCRKGNRLGDVKYAHWYSGRKTEPDIDLFVPVFFDGQGVGGGSDEADTDEVDAAATKFIRSPLDGVVPADLSGYEYHILSFAAQGARVAVLCYMTGSYELLYQNFTAWFDALSLTNRSGYACLTYLPFYKMGGFLLGRGDKWKSIDRIMAYAMRACVERGPLPGQVLSRSLSRFLSDLLDSDLQKAGRNINYRTAAWIKLYLIRAAESRKEDSSLMAYLNENHPNPAYHCGRIMAVYTVLQESAKTVNAGVAERFYASCSRSPALVLGTLQNMANHWFDDLKYQNKKNILKAALGQAYGAIDTELPKNLSMEDRGYFTMGYVQQTAALNKAFHDLSAQNKFDEEEK